VMAFVLRQGDDPGVETHKAVTAAVPLFFCSVEKIGATSLIDVSFNRVLA